MTTGVPSLTIGRLPRIAFGGGSAADIPAAVARHGRRPLLLTRASFPATPAGHALLEALSAVDIEALSVRVPRGEPTPGTVDAIVDAVRNAGIDVVVAIGGGSVLDTGKAVAGLLGSGTRAADHLEGVPEQRPYPGPALPWIAVPTTAGTGSEATRNAVLAAGGEAPAKRSFRDERLVAAEAIVDPDLLIGLTPDQIAASGADALTQLLESFVSTRANRFTDALALDGLRAGVSALPRWHAAVERGDDDPEARSAVAYAALLSGICLAHTGLGVVHGLVAPLGAHTTTPHGAGCGALLAAGVEANIVALRDLGTSDAMLARFATIGRVFAGDDGVDDPGALELLVPSLRRLAADLRLPGLGRWGLTDAIAVRVASLARSSSSMRTNPVELQESALVEVLLRSR